MMIHSDSEYGSDEEYQIDSLRKLQPDLNYQSSSMKENSKENSKEKVKVKISKELETMRMPKMDGKVKALKRSKSEVDVLRFEELSDELSIGEEDKIHFSPNYFIHDYSSDTDDRSVHS
jgi:hypothetical protein